MDATTRFDTQRVGALPVIAAYLEKLRLRETIDEVVPWEGEVGLGSLVEVMACNRMLNPKAQYKIGEWSEKTGICDYYGISSEELNDDRLGRALERIATHSLAIQSQLILHVVKTFKLDVSKIHYDISTRPLLLYLDCQISHIFLGLSRSHPTRMRDDQESHQLPSWGAGDETPQRAFIAPRSVAEDRTTKPEECGVISGVSYLFVLAL